MKDMVLPAWRSLYDYLHVSGLGGNEAINCRGRGNILVEEVILMTSHSDVGVQTSLSNKHWISLKSDAGFLAFAYKTRVAIYCFSSIAPATCRTFRTPARTTQSTKQYVCHHKDFLFGKAFDPAWSFNID